MVTPPSFDLKGRVALVTGGTRGIGRHLAAGLGAAGARVFLTGRETATVDAAAGDLVAEGIDAEGIAWDVRDTGRTEEVVDHVLARAGSLDVLVNNAGIIERAPAAEVDLDSWHRVLDTNLTGAFALARAVGRPMVGQGWGRIINIASVLGFSGGRNVVSYAVAKGGLLQLTRALAVEWSRYGVTVNAIAAGYVETELTAALREDPQRSAALLARIPAGRWGTGDDLVGATVFLASEAAAYVTGSALAVDGGWLAS